MKKTYILADNQDITKEGISSLLKTSALADNIIAAKSLSELQDKLKIYPNSVVVLDYTLFDFASMQQMLIVKQGVKSSAWVLFSEELGEQFLRHVLLADSSLSVVMKHDELEAIDAALKSAAHDVSYICESVKEILQGNRLSTPPLDHLTNSERAILREISLGKTTKEIALEKNLSFHTVNAHRKNIFRKLEVNNVHEAVKYAIRAGIIDMAEYYI